MNETWYQHIMRKASSGRWICTVTAAITFAVLAIQGRINEGLAMDTIKMVFIFYFMKRATEEEKE